MKMNILKNGFTFQVSSSGANLDFITISTFVNLDGDVKIAQFEKYLTRLRKRNTLTTYHSKGKTYYFVIELTSNLDEQSEVFINAIVETLDILEASPYCFSCGKIAKGNYKNITNPSDILCEDCMKNNNIYFN